MTTAKIFFINIPKTYRTLKTEFFPMSYCQMKFLELPSSNIIQNFLRGIGNLSFILFYLYLYLFVS
jgi:hypothetical protein